MTEFGHIARRLTLQRPETEFNRGLTQFGTLLTSAMLVMVLLVFVAHVIEGRAPIETLLLALAIPYLPGTGLLGFVPLPGVLLVTLLAITGLYILAAEFTKRWFYRNHAEPA